MVTKGAKRGVAPGGLIEELSWHAAAGAAAELRSVAHAGGRDGAAGADDNDDEAEADGDALRPVHGGEAAGLVAAILMAARVLSDGGMGGEAAAAGSGVGGGGDIKGLDVDEVVRALACADNEVGRVEDAGVRLHPLRDGGRATRATPALSDHSALAKDMIEEACKDLHDRVVGGGVESDAAAAAHNVVAAAGRHDGRSGAAGRGTDGGGAAPRHGRVEVEVEGEGDREGSC